MLQFLILYWVQPKFKFVIPDANFHLLNLVIVIHVITSLSFYTSFCNIFPSEYV